MDTISGVADSVNPQLQVEGILRTMYDPRNSLTNEVSLSCTVILVTRSTVRLYHGIYVLAEAPSYGLPACTTISIRAGQRPIWRWRVR